MRAIEIKASYAAAALAELKQWLAITTTGEDALLASLIDSAVAMCRRFTGILPLQATLVEDVAADGRWAELGGRPFAAWHEAAITRPPAQRRVLEAECYVLEPRGDGSARIRIAGAMGVPMAEIVYEAGLADDWSALDPGLRHGIVRYAAELYRQRERGETDRPPAAVTALWRPWREVRL